MTQNNKYTMVDLFAGAGGLSTGFYQTGKFNILAAVENNKDMQATYKTNHSQVEIYSDILDIDFKQFVEKYKDIDVVVGGPPCQGFSNANRQRKHIVNQNNQLTKAYIEAIKVLQPSVFVLENVSMLASKTHMFLCANKDFNSIKLLGVKTYIKQVSILLPSIIKDVLVKCYENNVDFSNLILDEKSYIDFNVLYRKRHSKEKLKKAFNKHRKKLLTFLKNYLTGFQENDELLINELRKISLKLYNSMLKENNISLDALIKFIKIQQVLNKFTELKLKDIYIESYKVENESIVLSLCGYTVLDYIKASLQDVYNLESDVLNAASFGAPQNRYRFILIGTKKDMNVKETMPKPIFDLDRYNNVGMAIEDLEDEIPVNSIKNYRAKTKKTGEIKRNLLLSYLNDTNVLHNHINTKSRNKTLAKFQQLKPGENFHDLNIKFKAEYSNPSRTQNSIYRRLDYSEPSGTVVNVRKSMWIHPVKNRAISIREAARLQTFPDSYVFIGTKDSQYQQVGNAVPPVLARAIAEVVLKSLGDEPVMYLNQYFNNEKKRWF